MTAIVAGATGLVGTLLLRRLLDSQRYDQVIALSRHPITISHPKLRNLLTNFRDLDTVLATVRPDDVFCCLGTTMAKAGSREKFREVDYEYPLALAKITLALGAAQYLLVSALGANEHSTIYYNKIKGQVEGAIRALEFRTIHIFRPSLLLGTRKEKRPGEDVAKTLYKFFRFLIPEKYSAVAAEKVADAMLAFAGNDMKGIYIHESRQLQNL